MCACGRSFAMSGALTCYHRMSTPSFAKPVGCGNMPPMENLGFEVGRHAAPRGPRGTSTDPLRAHTAASVSRRLALDRVVFIPAGQPPHKTGRQISSAFHRSMMCLIATAARADWSVSRVELSRAGSSYTIQTLEQLRGRVGPDCELVFIAGADMALDLVNWYRPDAILQEARFVAVQRPGYDLSQLTDVLGVARAARVERVAVETPDVSGTEIRRRVADGRSITDLTPPGVAAYIRAAGLYVGTDYGTLTAAKREDR